MESLAELEAIETLWIAAFFSWILAMAWGPIRLLAASAVGNKFVVTYRHVSIEQRLRKWEEWMALPLLAFALSIVAGVSASLFLDWDTFAAGGLFATGGICVIYFVGLLWGMQDHHQVFSLEDLEDPGAVLAELRSQAVDGKLGPDMTLRAEAHLPNVHPAPLPRFVTAPNNFLREGEALRATSCIVRWRESSGRRIQLPLRYSLIMMSKDWTQWTCLGAAVILGSLTIALSREALLADEFTWSAGLVLLTISLLLSPVLCVIASRVALIYAIRLHVAHKMQVLQIRQLLTRTRRLQGGGPGDVVLLSEITSSIFDSPRYDNAPARSAPR